MSLTGLVEDSFINTNLISQKVKKKMPPAVPLGRAHVTQWAGTAPQGPPMAPGLGQWRGGRRRKGGSGSSPAV